MFEKEIQRGIKWLEGHDPHWYNKINVSRLAMFSNDHCLLGQWLGGTGDCSKLAPHPWIVEHGFSLGDRSEFDIPLDGWVTLKKEWIEAIRERRKTTIPEVVVAHVTDEPEEE